MALFESYTIFKNLQVQQKHTAYLHVKQHTCALEIDSWGRGKPEQHPFSKAALALVKMNSSKVTSTESRYL